MDNLSKSLKKALLEVKKVHEGKGKLMSWNEFKKELRQSVNKQHKK